MNKIQLDNKNIILKDKENYLNIDNYIELNIVVLKNRQCKLVILGTNNYQLNITLEENSSLMVNSLNKDNSVNICFHLLKNSCLTYYHSVLSKVDSVNNFAIYHEEEGSQSILNNNGINLSTNKLFFSIDGVIPKKIVNINCSQNSKIINLSDGNSKIIPNLIIDSNDIIASHSAYIGQMNEDEVFYLASRGINNEDIQKLLFKALLLGKMELSFEREEYEKKINEWW